jgi:hypothetical protein
MNYIKLTADVKAALLAGEAAANAVEDGGSCNLDGVILQFKGLPERLVVEALANAGVRTSKSQFTLYGTGYMINPLTGGQADKRYQACKAIEQHLRDLNYSAHHFFMLD